MKIQNLSVIFIVIAMPIILVLAYYISLQADTINMQTAYNTKLLDSTKEAIDAFEINTVEWNSAYSETADSKRRDVMASINTFTTSFANNLGVSGRSKEYILSHVPAIAFTLYDGYYIYSPAETRITVKDKNGVTVFMNEDITQHRTDSYVYITVTGGYSEDNKGKILYKTNGTGDGTYTIYEKAEDGTKITKETGNYTIDPEKAETGYEHILKPFTAYSEKVKSGTNENIVVNYSLDNYITVYGYMDDGNGTEAYVSKSGYLTDPTKITGLKHNDIRETTFNTKIVEPEVLSEQIVWKEYELDGEVKDVHIQDCYYVYEAEGNTKVYIDKYTKERFILNKNLEKISLEDLSKALYKKCTIPLAQGGSSQVNTYKKIYQNLIDGKWYADTSGNSEPISITIYKGVSNEIEKDYSAINYCVESYIFTSWVNKLKLEVYLEDGTTDDTILQISTTNNPDPESDTEEDSAFATHKKQVIKRVVENNLNQAITSYSREKEGEYRLPVLSEADWDQILRNVSIITFVQNIPIGLKEYNDYAIATSTVNKEYVDPEEIYLNASDGEYSTYYHMPQCQHLGTSNLIGYRNIDYIQKSYEDKEEKTCYYYKHSNNKEIKVDQACYECIVQRSLYKAEDTTEEIGKKAKAYYTTLARERYVARMSKLPSQINAIVSLVAHHVNEDGTVIKTETTKISEENVGTTYTRESNVSGTVLEDTSSEIAPNLGNFTTDYGIEQYVNTYSPYKSDAKGVITINGYTNNLVTFTVNELKQPNTSAYTAYVLNPGTKTDIYQGETKTLDLDNGDATINIVLKYEKNYVTTDGAAVESYAVINDYNDLTIVSKVTGITGKVRLRFTNGTKTYYSKYIFDIKESIPEDQRIIYCRIKNDTLWYENEWAVEVVPVDAGRTLAGESTNYIKYYTIREKTGLTSFADAVNGTKGPSTGAKTSERIFKLKADIPNVGTIAPIAGKSGKWFNGTFEGESHIISGITIDTDVNKYNAFGLFGWVGAPATIDDLKISNINIDLTNQAQKENYRAGGLAAACYINDDGTGGTINKISISNATIKGTAWVGGIVGENKKYLGNCSLKDSNVSSVGKTNDGIGQIYVGGIVGKTNNLIGNANVNNSIIGSSNITVKTSSNKNISNDEWNRNKYYVGGIAGYTNSNLEESIIVNNSAKIQGGKVVIDNSTDNNAETYTGGIVGYKDSQQEVNNNLQTNCTVSGHNNVGGIIGYNAGGKITGLTSTQTVSATGDNVGGIVGDNNSGSIENCINTSSVTGEQDVGGIIGRNEGIGSINNCTNKGLVTATKESAGGIIGSNETGTIENCTNENTITINNSQATNVGGIAGYNEGSIRNCNNKASIQGNAINAGGIVGYMQGGSINESINHVNITVQGKKNVGGIGGITYGTHINDCYNKARIIGQDNTLFTGSIDLDNLRGPDWNVEGTDYTGTGGITGKLYGGSINRCYNDGNISCNRNGGGITGVDFGGAIRYCYNSKAATISNNNSGYNRLGGICGSGFGVDIYGCYNVGTVTGNSNGTAAADASAGIVGYLVDNCWLPTIYFENIDMLESLPGTITIPEPGAYYIENKVRYCYNSGKISAPDANGGINGYIMFGTYLNNNKSTFVYNYYLNTSASTGIGRSGASSNECVAYADKAFKEQLYKWATLDNVPKEGSTKIYNTTAPLEIDLGYQGYGILWWQIKEYVNLTSNVFMCNRVKLDNGTYIDTYSNFGNTAYNQAIHINGATINFRDIGFSICKDAAEFANNKPVTNKTGCYKWVMMVPKGNYNIKSTTDFSRKSQVFINNQMLTPEGEEYNINVQNNTQIYVAPIIEMIEAKLKAKNITVVWERVETEVEAESKLFSEIYDANHNKINKVPAYYEKDPNGSKATISNGGKTVSVYLDKYDQIVKNQPIYFHRFEYYTRELVKPSIWAWDWYYRYNGPNVVSEGTDSGKDENAKEASCTIYIDIENLVDLLGNDTAKRYIPHTAKINMDYNINMWFDAGDFGSLFTNIFATKDSKLDWNIAIQKQTNGQWININSIPKGEITTVTNDNNELVTSFPKDGYYTVSKDIFNQDISGSLADVKYNDRLRIAIDITFKSVSAHSYFNIDTLNKPVLDITYGPNIIE